jgi:DNA-binding MarR family transcriptional regulator
MPHTKAGRAFTELILETFRFNGRLLVAGDRLAKPLGLTSSRWQVLGAIEEQPLPVAQIARKMGLARQNVQRLADVLEEEGIVEYAPNPNHQRAKLVCLTDKGRCAAKELARHQVLWANRITAGTSASELQSVLDLMKRLRSRLETDGSGSSNLRAVNPL